MNHMTKLILMPKYPKKGSATDFTTKISTFGFLIRLRVMKSQNSFQKLLEVFRLFQQNLRRNEDRAFNLACLIRVTIKIFLDSYSYVYHNWPQLEKDTTCSTNRLIIFYKLDTIIIINEFSIILFCYKQYHRNIFGKLDVNESFGIRIKEWFEIWLDKEEKLPQFVKAFLQAINYAS